jgi:hypothetical protein
MTDEPGPEGTWPTAPLTPYQGHPAPTTSHPLVPYWQPPVPYAGPPGQVRDTGRAILLYLVTFGIYRWYWYYVTHDEMKRHKGSGLGGGVALVVAIVAGVGSPFLVSQEVGRLYSERGWRPPVSGQTGLWYFPGVYLIAGPIIWFVQTNNALNDYWRALGVR